MAAMPMPPPMQRVTRPYRPRWRSISCRILVVSTAPVAPIGCPIETAPPMGLSFSSGISSSLCTARATEEYASFSSTTSMSSIESPAFLSAWRVAGIGPRPIYAGSTPATATETSLPATGSPSSSAFFAVVTSIIDAPLAGRVHALASHENVASYHLVDPFDLYARPGDNLLGNGYSEVRGRDLLERPAEGSYGCPQGRGDHYLHTTVAVSEAHGAPFDLRSSVTLLCGSRVQCIAAPFRRRYI